MEFSAMPPNKVKDLHETPAANLCSNSARLSFIPHDNKQYCSRRPSCIETHLLKSEMAWTCRFTSRSFFLSNRRELDLSHFSETIGPVLYRAGGYCRK